MSDRRPPSLTSDLDALSQSVCEDFFNRFGRRPSVVAAAPGRVNLIGEHIDYNDGFVMPMAIERYIVIAADVATEDEQEPRRVARLHSMTVEQIETINLGSDLQPGRSGWISYVEGVLAGFQQRAKTELIPAFDAVIGSNVPLGGGLSSSAALEVAMATLLETLLNGTLTPREKALLCQQAEHQFAGVPCGIMDQFSSVFGRASELMLIDCRSQEVTPVPMDDEEVSILITNSNVKHELTGGEYAQRRSQCDSALAKLGRTTWRDVTPGDVAGVDSLTPDEHKRARHVVSEIERTIRAAEAFRRSDWTTAGELMYASHQSLKDDFDVSCDELDVLVDIAASLGPDAGVLGSRMTGGGFGGCTVSLVQTDRVKQVQASILTQYQSKTGIEAYCFSSRPCEGAHVIQKEG